MKLEGKIIINSNGSFELLNSSNKIVGKGKLKLDKIPNISNFKENNNIFGSINISGMGHISLSVNVELQKNEYSFWKTCWV